MPDRNDGDDDAPLTPDDDAPLTPDALLLFELSMQLNDAFMRDPSISTMNRIYRELRTGRPEMDRSLRDYIGLLYRLREAGPALLARDITENCG